MSGAQWVLCKCSFPLYTPLSIMTLSCAEDTPSVDYLYMEPGQNLQPWEGKGKLVLFFRLMKNTF